MNELKFVEWLRDLEAGDVGSLVIQGIGDDGAICRFRDSSKYDQIIVTDAIFENTHFRTRDGSPSLWGRKLVMCNVSDVAAMGGSPEWMTVTFGVPKNFSLKTAKQVYLGIREACSEYNVRLIGGDTCKSDRIVLSATMSGRVAKGNAIMRSGAKEGDVLFVTGPLGDSLRSGHHLKFKPRLDQAIYLNSHYRIHAMMDLSDGLSKDLRTLGHESKVGALIYDATIPLRNRRAGIKSAYIDGEDFELLFAMSAKESNRLLASGIWKRKKWHFFPIGRVVDEAKGFNRIDENGKKVKLCKFKDHHF